MDKHLVLIIFVHKLYLPKHFMHKKKPYIFGRLLFMYKAVYTFWQCLLMRRPVFDSSAESSRTVGRRTVASLKCVCIAVFLFSDIPCIFLIFLSYLYFVLFILCFRTYVLRIM